MDEVMLTTFDNPFDPFTQYEDWWSFDIQKGYYCCSLLARNCMVADDASQEELSRSIEQSIDDILANDALGIYRKVRKSEKELVN